MIDKKMNKVIVHDNNKFSQAKKPSRTINVVLHTTVELFVWFCTMQNTQIKPNFRLIYKNLHIHNPYIYCPACTPNYSGPFQSTQADPRSAKCSVKGPITTVPFLPLFLHPSVPILSGVHGQAEHHLRGRAGCHWTLLRGKSMEPTIMPLSFSTSSPALHTETSSARVLRGGYISHGKL